MTKEDFYGYLREFEIYEGDIVLTVEYNENSACYFVKNGKFGKYV